MTWTVEVVGESLNCYLCLLSQSSSGETQQVLCACLLFWYRWRWGLDHRPSKFKLHGKVFIFAMIFFVAADSFVCWCSSLWNSYDIETFPVSQISWRWHIFQLDGTLNTNNPLIHGSWLPVLTLSALINNSLKQWFRCFALKWIGDLIAEMICIWYYLILRESF